MTGEIFDPTVSSVEEKFSFAERPQNLEGLKIGIVENTKYNSDVLLIKIAERLVKKFQMEIVRMHRKKSASDYVTDEAIVDLKKRADFVLAGIGD
ncbi:MAG: hypothetical protein P8185_16820 [Deltaproteobacteria bacterium]|jgi:hypothetical protein